MMSMQEQLDVDLRTALKSGDKLRAQTIRGLKSALKYAEIEATRPLDEAEVLAVITKQAKQRRDAIEQFQQGGREDLVMQESAELALLEAYLPAQMTTEEVEAKVKEIITALGVTDMKGMGQVMGQAMAELKGKADGKVVNQIVRQLLSN
jgi:uncharacterized protein YqeY